MRLSSSLLTNSYYNVRMRSMTGFGRGNAKTEGIGHDITVEISSLNRKNLDLQISAPSKWSGFESTCKEWIKSSFERGRISVQIKVESVNESQDSFSLDSNSMEDSLKILRVFAAQHDLDFSTNSKFLLDLARATKNSSILPDWTELGNSLKEAFYAALSDNDAMRRKEGALLAADIKNRINQLNNDRKKIAAIASGSTGRYRDALLERLKNLELNLDSSDERVLKEIAIFVDRSDISEEITRLDSHFKQFLAFLRSDELIGRKMDFLCQEIHRELNTIGSKASDIKITQIIIESKNTLEQIREQVQNIE